MTTMQLVAETTRTLENPNLRLHLLLNRGSLFLGSADLKTCSCQGYYCLVRGNVVIKKGGEGRLVGKPAPWGKWSMRRVQNVLWKGFFAF